MKSKNKTPISLLNNMQLHYFVTTVGKTTTIIGTCFFVYETVFKADFPIFIIFLLITKYTVN